MLGNSFAFQSLHNVTEKETKSLKRIAEATACSFSLVHVILGANQQPRPPARTQNKVPARNGDKKRGKCVRLTME